MSNAVHTLPKTEWICIRHNRRAAVLASIFSLGLLGSYLLGAVGVSPPSPAGSGPFMVRLALVDGVAFLFTIFVSVRCVYERLWCGGAGVALGIMVLELFRPDAAGGGSPEIGLAPLPLWAALSALSLWFVWSAFKGARLDEAPQAGNVGSAAQAVGPRCPACGSPLARRSVKLASPFRCPACSAELRVPRLYLWWCGLLALALAACIAYVLGPTRTIFLIVLAVAWFPSALLVRAALRPRLPPRPVSYRRGAGAGSR